MMLISRDKAWKTKTNWNKGFDWRWQLFGSYFCRTKASFLIVYFKVRVYIIEVFISSFLSFGCDTLPGYFRPLFLQDYFVFWRGFLLNLVPSTDCHGNPWYPFLFLEWDIGSVSNSFFFFFEGRGTENRVSFIKQNVLSMKECPSGWPLDGEKPNTSLLN